MPKKLKLDGTINGIYFYLQLRGLLFSLRFTDPRSHEPQRIPTKQSEPQAAMFFAENYLRNYLPGHGGTVTVGELVETLLRFKKVNGNKDFVHARSSWNVRLKDKFANWDSRELTDDVITDYKAWMLDEPIDELTTPLRRSWKRIDTTWGKSTINRDLALLSKAYNDNKIARQHAPKWGKYPEKE